MQTTVFFEVGGEQFSFTGKQLMDPGFTGVMTWQAITSDERVPDFRAEQLCPIQDVCTILVLPVVIGNLHSADFNFTK